MSKSNNPQTNRFATAIICNRKRRTSALRQMIYAALLVFPTLNAVTLCPQKAMVFVLQIGGRFPSRWFSSSRLEEGFFLFQCGKSEEG